MAERAFMHIETNGIRLHTGTAGPKDGRLVILLHGFPEFWYGWRHQIDALADAGCFVVFPDQRGYNLSDKPEDLKEYELDKLAGDIAGLIRHFGREKAVIIGHDWGGAVGWHLAAVYPELVELFIPVNIPNPAILPRVMASYPPQWLKSSYIVFFQLPRIPEGMLRADRYKWLSSSMKKSAKEGAFSKEEIRCYEEAWSQPGALTAMLNWYRAIRKGNRLISEKNRVEVPVRMIWGRDDPFLSIRLAKKSLETCKDGEMVLIGEATHWVLHEQHELVNRWILRFLEE